VASQELAARLRDLRLERKLSLAGVAEATGLSSSFLSLIENGKSDITFSRLYRLVQFYGVSLLEIAPDTSSGLAVVRGDERRRINSPSEGIDMYLLTPDTDRSMMPVIVVYQPGAEVSEAAKHPGEDFVHVLEGRFLLELDGDEPVVLEAGDSVYYRATVPHSWKNIGEGVSSFFGVMSPPSL
jgi:transcriptional regulator with XRE-family HTH domain